MLFRSQGNHQRKGGHPRGNEFPFGDVVQHLVYIEKLIEPNVRAEMKETIEKREESEHAPEADQPVLVCKPAQRRNRKGDEKEYQRPVTGRVRDELNWIRAQPGMKTEPGQPAERNQASKEEYGFEITMHENSDQ